MTIVLGILMAIFFATQTASVILRRSLEKKMLAARQRRISQIMTALGKDPLYANRDIN